MILPLPELASAALILCLGVIVQTAVGFGIGLVVVPLLLWTGRALPEAVAMLLGAAVLQTAFGTYITRAHIQLKLALGIAAVQWVCVPVGVLGMVMLAGRGEATIKQVVGAALMVLLTARVVLKPRPRDRVGLGWGFLAASSSGLLAGLVGMGGPPLVFYAMAHDWEKDQFRGFLWFQFLIVLPVFVLALVLTMGPHLLWFFLVGIASAPVLWLGARASLAVSSRWSARRLQQAAAFLLYAIGISSVLAPYLVG